MIEHRTFFGDGLKTFALPTFDLVCELERKTGRGLMGLFNNAVRKEISFGEAVEILRITLIGGGMTPMDAEALVRAYSMNRPFMETFAVVDGVLSTLFFGNEPDPEEPEMPMDETVFWTNDELEDEPQGDLRQAAASGDYAEAIRTLKDEVPELSASLKDQIAE